MMKIQEETQSEYHQVETPTGNNKHMETLTIEIGLLNVKILSDTNELLFTDMYIIF